MDRPALALSPSGSEERRPSFGPPSVPYVPPPSLEDMVQRAYLRRRERERVAGRLGGFGGILIAVTIPLSLVAVKAAFDRADPRGAVNEWSVFFGVLSQPGSPWGVLFWTLVTAQFVLSVWVFSTAYLLGTGRSKAAIAVLVGGGLAAAFYAVYMPALEAVPGFVGAALGLVAGAWGLIRPRPWDPGRA